MGSDLFPRAPGRRTDILGTDGSIRDSLVYAMIPDDFANIRKAWSDDLPFPNGERAEG